MLANHEREQNAQETWVYDQRSHLERPWERGILKAQREELDKTITPSMKH